MAFYLQFDPFDEMGIVPSFFNLKTELFIEGLKGADRCFEYKFHEERGYNESYFDQVRGPGVRLSSGSHSVVELYRIVLCYIVVCCIVLYCIVLYCIVLYCIVWYCIELY